MQNCFVGFGQVNLFAIYYTNMGIHWNKQIKHEKTIINTNTKHDRNNK